MNAAGTSLKNNKKNLVRAAIAVVTLVIIYQVYEHIRYVTTDNAQVEAHTVLITPKVSGYIVDVKVHDGQSVKKGDLLVSLEPRDFENAVQVAKGDLASLDARKSDSEKNFHRMAELFQSAAVSRQQFDSARAQFEEARAKFDAVHAQVEQAELNLSYAQLRAPSDGEVARVSAEIGQLASAGTPLVGFVSSEARWVVANFKETEIDGISAGKTAEIDIDAISGPSFTGVVEAVLPATGATFTLLPPDNATGNFTKVVQRVPVRIALKELSPAQIQTLRAGLSAYVKVKVK